MRVTMAMLLCVPATSRWFEPRALRRTASALPQYSSAESYAPCSRRDGETMPGNSCLDSQTVAECPQETASDARAEPSTSRTKTMSLEQ